jgi:hypothetical protein
VQENAGRWRPKKGSHAVLFCTIYWRFLSSFFLFVRHVNNNNNSDNMSSKKKCMTIKELHQALLDMPPQLATNMGGPSYHLVRYKRKNGQLNYALSAKETAKANVISFGYGTKTVGALLEITKELAISHPDASALIDTHMIQGVSVCFKLNSPGGLLSDTEANPWIKHEQEIERVIDLDLKDVSAIESVLRDKLGPTAVGQFDLFDVGGNLYTTQRLMTRFTKLASEDDWRLLFDDPVITTLPDLRKEVLFVARHECKVSESEMDKNFCKPPSRVLRMLAATDKRK